MIISNSRKKIKLIDNFNVDFWLFISLFSVSFFGLFILYSASNQSHIILEKQIINLIIGFLVFTFVSHINPVVIKLWSPRIFLFVLFLLILVPLIGHQAMGAKRWINLGFITFQPSELMKLALPLMLSWFIYKFGSPNTFKKIVLCFLILIIPTFLILKQPDLGTSILVFSSGIIVIFLAGLSWKFIFGSFFGFLILTPILWNFLKEYQKTRIISFLSPEKDPTGSGYHVIQSKIAIGSGGFGGNGWLEGTQTHLNFIPEQRTDFIFSVLGEEFGFLGLIILLVLYTAIIIRISYMLFKMNDLFSKLVTGSVLTIFVSYIFINIGMVMGILPVVGVPLPLISYGGTSIVSIMTAFGLVSAFYKKTK